MSLRRIRTGLDLNCISSDLQNTLRQTRNGVMIQITPPPLQQHPSTPLSPPALALDVFVI